MQTAEITQALRNGESKQVKIVDAPATPTIAIKQPSEAAPTQTVSATTTWLRLAPAICAAWVAVGTVLEVWPESHWPGFALRQTDVL